MPPTPSTLLPRLLLLTLLTSLPAATTQPTSEPAAPKILMHFPIPPGIGQGNALLLPVSVNNQPAFFLLDTGASFTIFDIHTPNLGPPVGQLAAQTPNQKTALQKFNAPTLLLDNHPILFGQPIIAANLENIRQATGLPIAGILGMDVLSRYILQLDFKNQQILFLDPSSSLPKKTNTFTLGKRFGCPVILINFLNQKNTLVFLDTGCLSDGIVRPTFIEPLNLPTTRVLSILPQVNGTPVRSIYRVQPDWSFAGTSYPDIELSPGTQNFLGLNILSNYIATFDFPHDSLTLESIRPIHPTPLPHLGYSIYLINNKHIIAAIDTSIPTPLQLGDELLMLNNTDITPLPQWLLRKLLSTQPQYTLTLRRKNKTLQVTTHLPGY